MSDPVRITRLADRVRGVLGSAGAPAVPTHAVPSTHHSPAGAGRSAVDGPGTLERALGGAWTEEGGPPCFVVERRVAPDEWCGAVRVGDIASRLAARHDPALAVDDPAGASAQLLAGGDRLALPYLFFDLETTGLSGGAGTYAFLVGCASFGVDGALLFKQFVVSHPGQERSMLQRLSGELRRAGALVSFNGRSFDAPLLETRYAFHRLAWPGEEKPHLDVLHPARRFWSARNTGRTRGVQIAGETRVTTDDVGWRPGENGVAVRSCSLVTLEQQVLGVSREDDVPGADVPMRYFDFMRSGDARLIAPVLEHNRRDLLSLAGLMARLLHLLDEGPSAAHTARESLALGRLYERVDPVRAHGAYVRALEMARQADTRRRTSASRDIRAEAQRSLAVMARRRRQYDDAAGWWRGVLIDAPRGSILAREASEALAVHAEHREGDLGAAKEFALASRSVGGSSWDRSVERRLARLDRKLGHASRRGELLIESDDSTP